MLGSVACFGELATEALVHKLDAAVEKVGPPIRGGEKLRHLRGANVEVRQVNLLQQKEASSRCGVPLPAMGGEAAQFGTL